MGYTYRNNGAITDYWPDNDDHTLYIYGNESLEYIIERSKEHFGDRFDMSKINISAEYINTSCLTYDCYDSSDYTNFVVITLN